MDAQELIERVMTEHWDIATCTCLFCCEARELGFAPRERYLQSIQPSILDERPQSVAFAKGATNG